MQLLRDSTDFNRAVALLPINRDRRTDDKWNLSLRGSDNDGWIGMTTASAIYSDTKPLKDIKPVIGGKPLKSVANLIRIAAATGIDVLVRRAEEERVHVVWAVHGLSERRQGAFIRVNYSELSLDRLEAGLFGHVTRGAPGESIRHRTSFERVFKGTLFLNNVESIPRNFQSRFLRLLQDCELLKGPGKSPCKSDVRLVASAKRGF